MKDKKESKDVLHKFFREEGIHLLHPERSESLEEQNGTASGKSELGPVIIPEFLPANEKEKEAFWRKLRRIFRTGDSGLLPQYQLHDDLIPATLAPFKAQNFAQASYPFWIGPDAGDEQIASPLNSCLEGWLKQLSTPSNDRLVLQDQLGRLALLITKKLEPAGEAIQATPLIREALTDLKKMLDIKGEEESAFEGEIEQFRQLLPAHGILVPYSPMAPFRILDQYLSQRCRKGRERLLDRINPLISGLTDMIGVEKLKRPEATSPEKLRDALEFADAFVHFDKLSSFIPHDTDNHMPEERLARLQKILSILTNASDMVMQKNACIVLSKKIATAASPDWRAVFRNSEVLVPPDNAITLAAGDRFEQMARSAAQVIVSIRIAELELADRYVPAVHQDYFSHFTWKAFTPADWSYCTPVLLIAEDTLLYQELNTFSRLLASNQPIVSLCIRSLQSGEASGDVSFRRELGALALAHRNTFILQTSAISPGMLFAGIQNAMENPVPMLLHLLTLGQDDAQPHIAFLRTSAAVEGREFPGFIFDNTGRRRWGSRFNIDNNPDSTSDWPTHHLEVQTKNGETRVLTLPFTYADFSSLQASLRKHFVRVPPEYWSDDLVLIDAYLLLSEEEAYARIPFVWMMDGDRKLHKIAVSWPIVARCRERLDFWHFLQENAGVHSYHVEKATEQLKQIQEKKHLEQLQELQSKHAEELEKTRAVSAKSAMEKLAGMLLDLDTASTLADVITTDITDPDPQVAQEIPQTTVATSAVPEDPPEEPDPQSGIGPMEAYIDTPLCTSCNECTDLNNRIFSYDSNKQAFIQDVSAGPFSDLVKAAELCPVHVIHPGTPANSDEEGLEEWMKRAEPFN